MRQARWISLCLRPSVHAGVIALTILGGVDARGAPPRTTQGDRLLVAKCRQAFERAADGTLTIPHLMPADQLRLERLVPRLAAADRHCVAYVLAMNGCSIARNVSRMLYIYTRWRERRPVPGEGEEWLIDLPDDLEDIYNRWRSGSALGALLGLRGDGFFQETIDDDCIEMLVRNPPAVIMEAARTSRRFTAFCRTMADAASEDGGDRKTILDALARAAASHTKHIKAAAIRCRRAVMRMIERNG